MSSSYLDCGPGVAACGVLALESGYGTGYYEADAPRVHGLWPEVEPYGNAECVAPTNSTEDPTRVYACYDEGDDDDALAFQTHEWEKHGWCSGVRDADAYFEQVCGLSRAPLAVMNATRHRGGDLDAMAADLEAAGYAVHSLMRDTLQVQLSACAVLDDAGAVWTLAARANFSALCGTAVAPPDNDDDDDAAGPADDDATPTGNGNGKDDDDSDGSTDASVLLGLEIVAAVLVILALALAVVVALKRRRLGGGGTRAPESPGTTSAGTSSSKKHAFRVALPSRRLKQEAATPTDIVGATSEDAAML
mmetsp:Transcript_18341/g.73313  ORF Transcript_18341/g.73313 Transcript_18341/m.73313 type:complete len:306 (-) Transcript_18341:229-1146(-)